MMSATKIRELGAADSARIKCLTAINKDRDTCGAQATVVHEVHWNTGNTTGVSFFYHCDEHGRKATTTSEEV